VRRLLPIALVACAPPEGPTELGPAVLSIYLGNDTEVADIVHLRSGSALVFGTEVDTEGIGPRDAIRGASVEVRTGDTVVPAEGLGQGAYLTDLADARALAPTGEVSVRLEKDGDVLGMTGPTPDVLVLPLEVLVGDAGEDLEVELPARWWRSYTHVITQVLDLDGRIVWTDRPESLDAWILRLADPPQPRRVVVPGRVLDRGSYVIAAAFVDQMDGDLDFEGPINEPFSGLWAGTAQLVPLEIR